MLGVYYYSGPNFTFEFAIRDLTLNCKLMVVKEAELLFQAGALQTPVIKKSDTGDGWVISLEGTHKLNPTLEIARGGPRVFKKLDAAVGVLFDIGFSEIKIVQ